MDFDYSFDVINPDINGTITIGGTGSLQIPVGTTGQRPTGIAGMSRLNSTTGLFEYFNGSIWVSDIALVQILTGSIAVVTGTTSIPFDGTTPLSTEGTQIWTQAVTPSSTTSIIEIDFSTMVDNSATVKGTTITLFRGTTCIGVKTCWSGDGGALSTAGSPGTIAFNVIDRPGTLTAQTYSANIGSTSTGSTWYLNRAGLATYNNVSATQYIIKEYV